MSDALKQSYAYCREVTREHARNFYYGMKLTPEPKRSAMYAIYTWMRTADDLADDGYHEQDVAAFSQMTDRALAGEMVNGPVQLHEKMWPAVCEVFKNYPIEPAHLHAMIAGQQSDLADQQIATFDDLYQYCYRVASVVGLVSVAIWGHDDDPRIAQWAEQRGIAFQLTNILRDVREDAQLGRTYLPADDLAKFGCSEKQVIEGSADENFVAMMHHQIDRARVYYEKSAELEAHLSPDCRTTSATLCRIYRALLERIARDPSQVLSQRVSVPKLKKIAISVQGRLGKW